MLNLNQHILTKFCIHPQVARKISELTESPSTDLRETFITWNDLASLKLKPWQYAGTQKERIVSQPPRFRGKLLDLQIYGACSFSLTRLTFITLKRYPPWNYHITPESHSSLFLFFCNSTPEMFSCLEDGHFLGSFGRPIFSTIIAFFTFWKETELEVPRTPPRAEGPKELAFEVKTTGLWPKRFGPLRFLVTIDPFIGGYNSAYQSIYFWTIYLGVILPPFMISRGPPKVGFWISNVFLYSPRKLGKWS